MQSSFHESSPPIADCEYAKKYVKIFLHLGWQGGYLWGKISNRRKISRVSIPAWSSSRVKPHWRVVIQRNSLSVDDKYMCLCLLNRLQCTHLHTHLYIGTSTDSYVYHTSVSCNTLWRIATNMHFNLHFNSAICLTKFFFIKYYFWNIP